MATFGVVCMLVFAFLDSFAFADEAAKSVLHDSKVTYDRNHIKEHVSEEIDLKEEEMSDEDLQFHFFRLHDYDGNRKLDGLELLHAVSHNQNESEITNKDETSDEANARTVDYILDEDDLNSDGYIDYPEYIAWQKNAALNGTESHAN